MKVCTWHRGFIITCTENNGSDAMNPLSLKSDGAARSRAAGKTQTVYLLVYLLVLFSVFSFQSYFITRFLSTNLAVYSSEPAIYAQVKSNVDAILNAWEVIFLVALTNPVAELVATYIRHIMEKRRKLS